MQSPNSAAAAANSTNMGIIAGVLLGSTAALYATYSFILNNQKNNLENKYNARPHSPPMSPEEYTKEFDSPNRDINKLVTLKMNVTHILSTMDDRGAATVTVGNTHCSINPFGYGQIDGKISDFDNQELCLNVDGANPKTHKIGILKFSNNRLVLDAYPGHLDTLGKWSFQYVTDGPGLKLEMILSTETVE